MPINAHPDYLNAEKEYIAAQTLEEKIEKLKKMISYAPGHKGAENLRAQLKTRLKKLKEQQQKVKKSGKGKKQGIKKEDMQALLIGTTNTGKSSILNCLTNTNPKISSIKFTTTHPEIGMFNYNSVQIQLVENLAMDSEYFDKSLTNTTDTILFIITNLKELENLSPLKEKSRAKIIVIFNKSDLLTPEQKRKIAATLQSKKYNFVLCSALTKENIEELQEKIFNSFDNLRIFTKEPGKNKSDKPMILPNNATVADVAEKILKGLSTKIKQTKIWGPSSKFGGQIVGLKHKVKDLDVVEFKTR